MTDQGREPSIELGFTSSQIWTYGIRVRRHLESGSDLEDERASETLAVDEKKAGGIQSLVRASGLLDQVARNRDGIGLAQLSKTVGLHTSTAFHLLKTLGALGYVRQDEATKLYRIGPAVFKLAATAFDEVEIANLTGPFLDELAMLTTETSHFAVRSGEEIVIIARAEGTGAFRIAERTGVTRPAHATAIGKTLLAAMSVENARMFLENKPLVPLTSRTITDQERLFKELENIRRSGVAFDDGEFHPELRCISTAVRNFTGDVVGAVGISTATWRLSLNELASKTTILREVADRISAEFGHKASQ